MTTEAITEFNMNEWADFWRYQIGVNVIPAFSKTKNRNGAPVPWKEWENKPIPEELHNKWKTERKFETGISVMAGKCWHSNTHPDWFLCCVDIDNQKAIDELSKEGIIKLAKNTIVEQHKDNPNKAHVYFYTSKIVPKKSSDNTNPTLSKKINSNEIPAYEVKGSGEHGLLFATPSIHEKGERYEIIGITEPMFLDEIDIQIDKICEKYGMPYLSITQNGKALIPMNELLNEETKIHEGHNRHEAILRIAESFYRKNPSCNEDEIFLLTNNRNLRICVPPLTDDEVRNQVKMGMKFILKENQKTREKPPLSIAEINLDVNQELTLENNRPIFNQSSQPVEFADFVQKLHSFKTLADTAEILYFKNGVYLENGEVIIEQECQRLAPTWCNDRLANEVKGIIQRRTYINRRDLNKDLSKLVFNNGILNLKTGEFNPEHNPDFLTTIKIDYDYNPDAKCPKFLKLLEDCLGDDPRKIVQLVEIMSNVLTMNHANFETSLIMVGDGANGKSTILKILRGIFGPENIASISIHAIQKERFAIAQLDGKLANIYADISNTELWSLGRFKMAVSGDPITVEKKGKDGYQMVSFAKHFFSANEMPDIKDNTDGAFRRIQVIKFENEFRPDLGNCIKDYDKIILAEESSGIFNLLYWNYKNIMKHDFRFKQSIADVRNTIKRESDKLREYIEDCFTKKVGGFVTTEELYLKYVEYCKFKSYEPHTKQKFTNNLSLYGLKPDSRKIENKTCRGWIGIEWNFEDEWVKSNVKQKAEMQAKL
ncbi:MAG: bifunctional DNA primase/polymerase [Thaumarchaeota archaeon]|nr:bifunctional DNA primase/polymerase [Nitrososphaerota archaeon]